MHDLVTTHIGLIQDVPLQIFYGERQGVDKVLGHDFPDILYGQGIMLSLGKMIEVT